MKKQKQTFHSSQQKQSLFEKIEADTTSLIGHSVTLV